MGKRISCHRLFLHRLGSGCMNNREKGFTYPLTLAVLILFLMMFSVRVEQFYMERRQANETATILQEEYYFHTSVKRIEKMLQSGEPIPKRGTFSFMNGVMEYQAETVIGTVQWINFTLRLHTGELWIGRGLFDINLKKLTMWIEKK
jgi:hypothetical protein